MAFERGDEEHVGRAGEPQARSATIQSFAEAKIEAYSTRTRRRSVVVENASFPIFLAPGRLFFVRAGGLFEAGLDVERLALVGEPRLVQDGVSVNPLSGYADVALARDGTLLYVAGGDQAPLRRLVELARDGSARPIAPEAAPYQWMRASPDGRTIAVDIDAAGAQIWLLERERGTRVRLTESLSNNFSVWLRDGQALFYASGRGTRFHLFEQRLDGSAPRSILESETAFAFNPLTPTPSTRNFESAVRCVLCALAYQSGDQTS